MHGATIKMIIKMLVFILFQVIQERKVLHAQRQNESHTSSSIEDVALGSSVILLF